MSLIQRLTLLVLLVPWTGGAQDVYVPEALDGWQQWVLEGHEYRNCPFYFDRDGAREDAFECAWPGRLVVLAGTSEARFTLRWSVYASAQWLPLPGSPEYWPHDVTADGQSVPVVLRDGVPSVYLGPGEYELAGRFEWDARPGILPLPPRIGLLQVTVDGRPVALPERSGGGVFLGERKRESTAEDALRVEVYRRIVDEIPTRLQTLLRIEVAGEVREETLAPALPQTFVPMSIRSGLPTRLGADGTLQLQVRPGSWIVDIGARAERVVDSIRMPEPILNLPATEIWSFAANDAYRVAAAEGLPPVDPVQADVPPGWRQLPAFRAAAGATLEITERSRGIVAVDNALQLQRQMWLDFDGDGFTVSDRIGGTMRVDWRLDMRPPYALLHATEDTTNLLITLGDHEGETGVELRRAAVDLETIGRIEGRRRAAVTGWDTRFGEVGAVVNLPPGHKLLAAPGVDVAAGSWVSQWQLLDFFLVLITTIATWRLFGRAAGLVALAALALSYHELQAPAWLWLNLLVAIALASVAPEGPLLRSVRAYRAVSAVLLVLALVPFIASQLRIAIYPQLEPQFGIAQGAGPVLGRDQARLKSSAEVAALEESVVAPESARELEIAQKRQPAGLQVSRSDLRMASDGYSRYAPNAIVQAGPGKPSWRWNSYRLDWSGPVEADQSMWLVILPRWAVTVLRFLQVALLLGFAGILLTRVVERQLTLPGGLKFGRSATGVLAVGMLGMLLTFAPAPAQADTPDPELLRELERRLLDSADCAPRCAEIRAADVEVASDELRMSLVVETLEDVAVPLPGSEQGWRPRLVFANGTAARQVLRGEGRALWIRLPPGSHVVVLSGPLVAADSIEIPFPAPPRLVAVDADGWLVAGIRDGRLPTGSLQLTRRREATDGSQAARWESSRFPVFATVRRELRLDLDWSVTTTVARVAPERGALTLEIPLLEGEAVLTEGIEVAEDSVVVSMAPEQSVIRWTSSLPRQETLALRAGTGVPWQEIWRVGVSSSWHAEFSGVPESERGQASGSARVAHFFPRAGETLTIAARRPAASSGNTLAFDRVKLDVEPGARSRTTRLELDYRSTRGAQHVLTLPAAAEITEVSIDGRVEPLRSEGSELTLPILPGEHSVTVAWRSDTDIAARIATPFVNIAAPASNISLGLTLPGNRWLLATGGPPLAPAVLYWSELAVLLLFAAVLGRLNLTPLKSRHWVLLGLGFSTFSWPVLAWVVVWLLVCGARERWHGGDEAAWWQFNAVQVLVAGLTITALGAIVASLPAGLLGTPDMHVTGNGSFGNSLNWFADRSMSELPTASALSVPLWAYKALILAWALWLSFALLRWLPWVWRCFSSQGFWRSRKAAA